MIYTMGYCGKSKEGEIMVQDRLFEFGNYSRTISHQQLVHYLGSMVCASEMAIRSKPTYKLMNGLRTTYLKVSKFAKYVPKPPVLRHCFGNQFLTYHIR